MAFKSQQRRKTPREVWGALATENITTARELLWIADRSTQTLFHILDGGTELPDPDSEPSGERLTRALYARFSAEHEAYSETSRPEPLDRQGAVETELLCLLIALRKHASAVIRDAELHQRLATAEARGRPKKYTTNALAAHSGLRMVPKSEAKGSPGRPLSVPIPDEALEYFVKDWPQRFGDSSLSETLREIATCYLNAKDSLPASAWRRKAEIDKIVTNLRKRVSALRLRSRKS